MKFSFLIWIFVVSFFGRSLIAQNNCLNSIKEARDLYEEGLIDEIPKRLAGCMASGFSRAQKIEAYKLIVLAYLFDDDQFATERTMNEFLKKFPEYEVMPSDPIEFVYLLKSYKTASYYSVNFIFGPVFSRQRLLEPFSVFDESNVEFKSNIGTGFQAGLGFGMNFFKTLNGSISVIYSWQKYSYQEFGKTSFDIGEANFADVKIYEKLEKVDVPLTFSLNLGRGKVKLVPQIGGMASFLYKPSLTAEWAPSKSEPLTVNNIDMKDNRPVYYYSALAGIGLHLKIPRGFFVLDLKYHYGLQNLSINENRFSNPRLFTRFYHLDNDFSLDYLSVNLGYHFSIYKSKKSKY